jgi:hypothetical protein
MLPIQAASVPRGGSHGLMPSNLIPSAKYGERGHRRASTGQCYLRTCTCTNDRDACCTDCSRIRIDPQTGYCLCR